MVLARRGGDSPYVLARSFNCGSDVAAQGLASGSIPIYTAIWQTFASGGNTFNILYHPRDVKGKGKVFFNAVLELG